MMKTINVVLAVAIFLLIIVVARSAYNLGAVSTCETSGGILLDDNQCVNYSSLGYCRMQDLVYFGEGYYAVPP